MRLAAWHGVRVGNLGESAAPLLLAGGLPDRRARIISLAHPAGGAGWPGHPGRHRPRQLARYLDAAHPLSGARRFWARFSSPPTM